MSNDDRATLKRTQGLKQLLQPAELEDSGSKLQSYFALLANRIRLAGKQADQEHIGPATHFEQPGQWMFTEQSRFILLKGDQSSAFAAGGSVYFTSGLVDACHDEDELAASLCRAYAHLYARDFEKAFQWPGSNDRTELLRALVNFQYTPAQRVAAEETAFAIYSRGGWDPPRFDAFNQRQVNATANHADRTALQARLEADRHRLDAMPASARDWRQPPIADERHFTAQKTSTRALAASISLSEDSRLAVASVPEGVLLIESVQRQQARRQLAPAAPTPGQSPWGKGLSPR